MKLFIKKILPTRRKLIQLYAALLCNAHLKGFQTGTIYGGATKGMCVPGLNCYSCPGAVGACPLGSLQGAFHAGRSTLFYVVGILLLFGILGGRTICGWLCPFGLLQELVYKIKTPKLRKNRVTRGLRVLKYVVLVVFVLLVPLAYACRDLPLPAFCKYICPAGTLEGGLGLLSHRVNDSYFAMLGPLFTWKFLLLVSITLGCVFVFRLFCRFLCPLGALYALFNRICLCGVTLEKDLCTQCGQCVTHCRMDVRRVGDAECIHCGECMKVCATGAIHWKGRPGRVRLEVGLPNENGEPSATSENVSRKKRQTRTSRWTRCIAAVLMLAVLCGTWAYFWWQTPDTSTQVGGKVGDMCASHELVLLNAAGDSPATVNPARMGMVTVINFWGTWCTPCKQELPDFDRIADVYAGRVAVIAVHTPLVADTAPAYIQACFPDSRILFAVDDPVDEEGLHGGYYAALGGRDIFPYTVVVDAEGRIAATFLSSVSYEELEEVIVPLLEAQKRQEKIP